MHEQDLDLDYYDLSYECWIYSESFDAPEVEAENNNAISLIAHD